MNDDLTECYTVLGLRPGASPADLKAAHRDLTKVWHPDRFLHDLPLQQRAQERLKQINEAYDLLSGKTKRKTPAVTTQDIPINKSRRSRWQLVLAPVLLFAAVFLVTSRSLLQMGGQVGQRDIPAINQVDDSSKPEKQEASSRVNGSANELPQGKDQTDTSSQRKRSGEELINESNATLLRPLPTVSVVIDPTTGMIARPSCPNKTSMTYPSGGEPKQYCSSHRVAPIPPLEKLDDGELRIKSAAKRLAAPIKLFDGKGKSAAGTNQP